MRARTARLAIVSLLALGLAAGFLSLSASPARALEKPSLSDANGSPTIFFGTDALGSNTAGSYRVGKAPFTVTAFTTGAAWSGSYPMTFAFVWGDGAANVSTQTCFSCTPQPVFAGGFGAPGLAGAQHTYNVAGTYNAIINVTDALGVFRSDTYKVQVFSVSPTFIVKWKAWVEGQGIVANLSRQTNLAQPIVAYVYNNATYPITGGLTTSWYMDSWANLIYQKTYSVTIFPTTYFPVVWPGNIPNVISTPGTHHFWVKTGCVGCSVNVTTPSMTVIYTASTVAPSMTATQLSGSISNLQPGQSTVIQYRITNPSSFTINWFDQVSFTNNLLVLPEPALTYAQYGPVINNTVQVYTLATTTSGFTDQGNYPLTNLGYLLAPGQNLTISQEVFYPPVGPGNTLVAGGTMIVSFTPFVAASCTAPTTNAGASCAYGGSPVTATSGITTGGTPPASITTAYGQQIANGTVVLVGYVNSLGGAAAMQVYFTFVSPNGTTYTRPTQIVTGPITVQDYIQGLAVGNYSAQMFGTTTTGVNVQGGTITFTVGLNFTPSPTSNSQGFTQSILYAFASVSGIPAVIFGALVGMAVIFSGIAAIVFMPGSDGMKETVLMLWILVGVIINVWMFLWPSIVLLVILVPEGILLYEKFTGGTSGGGGEEARG